MFCSTDLIEHNDVHQQLDKHIILASDSGWIDSGIFGDVFKSNFLCGGHSAVFFSKTSAGHCMCFRPKVSFCRTLALFVHNLARDPQNRSHDQSPI